MPVPACFFPKRCYAIIAIPENESRETSGARTVERLHIWLIGLTGAVITLALGSVLGLQAGLRAAGVLPEAWQTVPYIAAGLLTLAGLLTIPGWLIRKTPIKEPRRPAQWESIGLWMTAAGSVVQGLFLLTAFLPGGQWFLLTLPFLPLILPGIFLVSALKPFPARKNGCAAGCVGNLALVLLACCVTMRAVTWRTSIDYTGDDPDRIPHLSARHRKDFFPDGATQIRISGRVWSYQWSCRVSEADFLAFQKKSSCRFRKNQSGFNLNSGPAPAPLELPEPYYYYNSRARNGGGVTMTYEVATGMLTGSYSDR